MTRLLPATVLLLLVALPPSAAASPSTIDRPTVAVLYFDYEGPDPELAALSKGLASMLITDMSANTGFDVVERERLQELIEELELTRSDLVDPSKAVRIGRLASAQRMVVGRYFELMGQFRIDARMFDVETSVQVCSVGVTGNRADFFGIEADIADKLSIAVMSDGENCHVPREGSPPLVPVRDGRTLGQLDVGVAADYSRALDAIDEDQPEQAKTLLTKVVEQEPEFVLAASELKKLLK